MKKKITILILALVSLFCLSMFFVTGCGGSSDQTLKASFREHCITSMTKGNKINIEEFVNTDIYKEYELIATLGTKTEDLSTKQSWSPKYIGDYTLTLTYNNTTATMNFTVKPQEISWNFDRVVGATHYVNDSFEFEELSTDINLFVLPVTAQYTFNVESVYHNSSDAKSIFYNGYRKIFEEGTTSFTFPENGQYQFKFSVTSSDGQYLTDDVILTVRKKPDISTEFDTWAKDNSMEYSNLAEGKVNSDGTATATLFEASYTGSYINTVAPYLAYKQEIGENDFLQIEFTGKNCPQFSFFTDKISDNPCEEGKGFYITNGLTRTDGSVLSDLHASRIIAYGPYKVKHGVFDNEDRLGKVSYDATTGKIGAQSSNGTVANPDKLSWAALVDGIQYRLIIGFTDVVVGDTLAGSEYTYTHVQMNILLISLTNSEVVWDYSYVYGGYTDGAGGAILLEQDADWFKGYVHLYGRYGHETKLDKVYQPVYVASGDIHELYRAASFKSSFKTTYAPGDVAKVSDFIEIPVGDSWKFIVKDPSGAIVGDYTTDETFTLTEDGTYRFIYDSGEEGVNPNSTTVTCFDPTVDRGADYWDSNGFVLGRSGGLPGIVNTINPSKKITDPAYVVEGNFSMFYCVNSTRVIPTVLEKAEGGTYPPYGVVIGISKKVVSMIFESNDVDTITFEIWVDTDCVYSQTVPWDSDSRKKQLYEVSGALHGGEWNTITITKEQYYRNITMNEGLDQALSYNILPVEFNGEWGGTDYTLLEKSASWGVYIDNIKVNMKSCEISETAKSWIKANNVVYSGVKEMTDDNSVVLHTGDYLFYANNTKKFSIDQTAYIAFKGSYGAGTSITVDFTGKNLPQVCLFVDYITSSLTDGYKGLYIHNGLRRYADESSGHWSDLDDARLTYFGPNKVAYGEFDNRGRLGSAEGTVASPSPFSTTALDENTKYSYTVKIVSTQAGSVTLQLVLTNRDTSTTIATRNVTLSDASFTDGMTGSIVLYGKWGVETTFDKVYAPVVENN